MKSLAAGFAVSAAILISSSVSSSSAMSYGDAVETSLMFFEAQRSGKLPTDQRVKWRGDSALRDGFSQGVDLVGGYYDAGDHVKFGLPMAFTVTMLAWGAAEFRKEIAGLNQMDHALRAIRWGTDYILKAHPQPDVLWAQVGDGNSDHYCWERAEDMTTPRNAYKLDHENPGSDLAGETAAALAAASLAFRPYNSSYSDLLLVHAKQLFSFADRFRGQYDDSIESAQQFYSSTSCCGGATWLYRATGDQTYLKYAIDNAGSMGGISWGVKEFSWDTKYAGVQVLLSKVLMDNPHSPYASILKQYQAKAEYFTCACVQKNDGYNVNRTPGGLMYMHYWNNMQYVSSASFLLAVYSVYLSASKAKVTCPNGQVQPQGLLDFAKSQGDYILGKNPKSISYLVGYGQSYPTHVHHRGASIASISVLQSAVGCVQGFDAWFHRPEGNPNVIYGALVGGPDKNDGFYDDRSNYEQTEPTLSACAPLIGFFSKLQSAYGAPGSYQDQRPGTPSTSPGSYSQKTPPAYTESPVQFLHSITSSWNHGGATYYQHQVIIKNISQKSVSDLKLQIENISGSLWGLTPTQEKNIYQLPYLQVLKPGSQYMFVYVQGGPQAKISVVSYH
ncbi:hypothetical protein NL676_004353 [Syzygium grande]|nr:hypothetical protein NL676_004353 [Syzygium grande]